MSQLRPAMSQLRPAMNQAIWRQGTAQGPHMAAMEGSMEGGTTTSPQHMGTIPGARRAGARRGTGEQPAGDAASLPDIWLALSRGTLAADVWWRKAVRLD